MLKRNTVTVQVLERGGQLALPTFPSGEALTPEVDPTYFPFTGLIRRLTSRRYCPPIRLLLHPSMRIAATLGRTSKLDRHWPAKD